MESAAMKVLLARPARFPAAAAAAAAFSSRFEIPRRPLSCSTRNELSSDSSASSTSTAAAAAAKSATVRTFSAAGGSAPETDKRSSSSFGSSSNDSNNNNNNRNDSVESLRERLLRAALRQVPRHGWTNDAIAAAAAAAAANHSGTSMASAGLITVPDLIAHSMDRWNERLRRELREEQTWDDNDHDESTNTTTNRTTTTTTTADRIAWALRRRLTYVQDLVRAGRWHEGMALGAHPDSLVQTQGQLAALMDLVLRETASEKEEFSVAERLSLGAVYVAAELHMLADQSPDFADTWVFLEQRVADWENWRTTTSTGSLIPGAPPSIPNAVSNLLQHHTPSDLAFTASAVGSALASGALSVCGPVAATNNENSFHPFAGQGQDFGHVHGTHPRDYEPPATADKDNRNNGNSISKEVN